ncbi:hypothetical protein BaRGS_00014110 [Batillaria attramentaria]|uniref:Uncharacterized protein n=1 Tax=Batillaria attramentaria TaxID=370345 RepID=A0ABD0L6F5_9CAEN
MVTECYTSVTAFCRQVLRCCGLQSSKPVINQTIGSCKCNTNSVEEKDSTVQVGKASVVSDTSVWTNTTKTCCLSFTLPAGVDEGRLVVEISRRCLLPAGWVPGG